MKIMKKTMNLLLMALLTVGLVMNLTSCKEDELTEEEKQQQAAQALEEAQEWWDVVSQLTDVQTLPDDWQKATFEPTIGKASENDPYTRVVATNDLSTAAQRFAYLTGAAVNETTSDYTWSHKQAGSLTYHAGSPAGTYLAQVDVDLKQMPRLKKILYQTPDQMGENASGSFSGSAYYRFGDVVKKQNSKGFDDYWVCVRPAFSLEGKGDSHWVCLSDLPDENLFTYEYDKQSWVLPTKLGESKEHMQNFAEMMYAILDPVQYFANLSDPKLKVFHDFDRTKFGQYHNQYFWELVRDAWDDHKLFQEVFNLMDKEAVDDMIKSQGLSFIYKGYSWVTSWSWNCSLWEASYTGTNLKTATYSKPTKNMQNVEFKANIFNMEQKNYCKNFFGDDKLRFILRYATGETLSKDANGKGNYSVKLKLSNCEDVYVFNSYYYQDRKNNFFDLNFLPEIITEDDIKPQVKPKKLLEVTAADRGKLIGQDGMIYASLRDVRRGHTKAVAMIVDTHNTDYQLIGDEELSPTYYETFTGHIKNGIAIALENGYSEATRVDDSDTEVTKFDPAWEKDHHVNNATWLVPNFYHWQRMLLPYGENKIYQMTYLNYNLGKYEPYEFILPKGEKLVEDLNKVGGGFADYNYMIAGGWCYYDEKPTDVSLQVNQGKLYWYIYEPAEKSRYVLTW